MSFGRLERTRGDAPMSEINMTPLIDVMLVLLVIFIITAPLVASSIRLDLPRSDAATPTESPQFISLSLTRDGRVFFNDQLVDAAQLAQRLTRTARDNPETEVQLRADGQVPYARVVEAMGAAQKAGLARIGFITESKATQ